MRAGGHLEASGVADQTDPSPALVTGGGGRGHPRLAPFVDFLKIPAHISILMSVFLQFPKEVHHYTLLS